MSDQGRQSPAKSEDASEPGLSPLALEIVAESARRAVRGLEIMAAAMAKLGRKAA